MAYQGVVKNLLIRYGFISLKDGGRDIFFHESDLEGVQFADLEVGQEVEFEIERTDKGHQARKVRVI